MVLPRNGRKAQNKHRTHSPCHRSILEHSRFVGSSLFRFNDYTLRSFGSSVAQQIRDFKSIGINIHHDVYSKFKHGHYPVCSSVLMCYLSLYWRLPVWELLLLSEQYAEDGELDLTGLSLPSDMEELKADLLERFPVSEDDELS